MLARDEQRGDRLGAAGHREVRARRGSVEVIAPADHAEGTHDAELDVDDVRVTAGESPVSHRPVPLLSPRSPSRVNIAAPTRARDDAATIVRLRRVRQRGSQVIRHRRVRLVDSFFFWLSSGCLPVVDSYPADDRRGAREDEVRPAALLSLVDERQPGLVPSLLRVPRQGFELDERRVEEAGYPAQKVHPLYEP